MKKISDSTRKKMSEAAKLRCSPEWKAKKSESMRTKLDEDKLRSYYLSGMTQEEVAFKLGVTRKVVYNAMKRIGLKARVACKRNQWSENNHMWKGDFASKGPLHRRLYRRFGQENKCSQCGTEDASKSYDWANISGKYEDLSDYKRMCRSCHWKYDKKILNIKKMRE